VRIHWMPLIVTVAVFFGLLAFFLRAKTASSVFRSFVPSWRFFESTGSIPILQLQATQAENTVSSWMNALNRLDTPSAKHLFSNTDGNFVHAVQSVLRSFVMDQDNPSLNEIVRAMAAHYGRIRYPQSNSILFRVLLWNPDHPFTEEYFDVLVQDEMSLNHD